MDNLLEKLHLPDQIRQLNNDQQTRLAAEVREKIIQTVAQNGGHLASSLGTVELIIALLSEFDFTRDRVIFDVGHQAYAWKILTGRLDQFCTLRKSGGLSGFPKRSESTFDFFNTGHSSTSISAALGLSRAMSRHNRAGKAIAVIGDGALTGGMAFEALNDAGQSRENLVVILNDNQMSIGRNVGGLSRHLENLRISPKYIHFRSRFDTGLLKVPLIGRSLFKFVQHIKRIARMTLQHQGIFFEQLGFRYYGPIDGHDLPSLRHHLRTIQELHGPILLHVLTQKGRGYNYAEESPDVYHGVAPFIIENGVDNNLNQNNQGVTVHEAKSFSDAFGCHLSELAKNNPQICAISAAMTFGTGLANFAENYPTRFFDVGIAEQHAVTLAAGLAIGGMKPFVALYSTFFQRAYDQMLHDVCLQSLPVVLAIDRSGIVGEDGETHQGIYDLSLLLPLPNLQIFCPPDYAALTQVMDYALTSELPTVIRYPRGKEWPQELPQNCPQTCSSLPKINQARLLQYGSHVTLAALGVMAGPALAAAGLLARQGITADVLAIICAKPFDHETLIQSVQKTGHIVFIEENSRIGGFGQTELPNLLIRLPETKFCLLGIDDNPLCQGKREQLLSAQNLTPETIAGETVRLLKGS